MSVEKDLQILDDFNATLDKMIEFATNAFSTLEDLEGQAQEKIQEEVDKACIKVSDKANTKINAIRSKVIDILRTKYASATAALKVLDPIVNAKLTDLGSVIDTLTSMIDVYIKPYKDALEYTVGIVAEVIPKVSDTIDKIDTLVSLKDNIPIPDGLDINFDKLDIIVDPIGLGDIMQSSSEEEEEEEPDTPEEEDVVIRKLQITFNSEEEMYDYYSLSENSIYLTEGKKILVVRECIKPIDSKSYTFFRNFTIKNGGWYLCQNFTTEEEVKKHCRFWEQGALFNYKGEVACLSKRFIDKHNKVSDIKYEFVTTTAGTMDPPLYINVYKSGPDWSKAVD
jgi:hypothetical protein